MAFAQHEAARKLYALCLRTVLGTLVLTAVVTPAAYQPVISAVYHHLKSSALYQASTFETFWTVFCYAVIEPCMTVIFFRHPEWRFAVQDVLKQSGETEAGVSPHVLRRPKGMRRPSRRLGEALTYMFPLLLLDLTMIKKFADVDLESMLQSGNYNPSITSQHSYHGTNFLAPSLHNFSYQSPLQTKRALPQHSPSSRRLALELIFSFLVYDACFFLFHLSLHIIPLLNRWHAPHHSHAEINPQVTNQLHIAERLGLILLANFSLNIIGSHVLTRTLFVPVFVWLLIEIHSGLDVPWGYEKVLPRGCGGGARKHMLHHRHGLAGAGFEPYFEWCDGLLEMLRS